MGNEQNRLKITEFLAKQKQKQQTIERKSARSNKGIRDLVIESKPLSADIIEVFFNKDHQALLNDFAVESIYKELHAIRDKVNSFPVEKRFFILETMNFFSSKISIGKLVPALLVLSGLEQKKIIWEFVYPTFVNINNNVETLLSTNEIFKESNVHIERGSLYLFVSDIAKVIIKLFNDDFVTQFSSSRSAVEKVVQIIARDPKKKTLKEGIHQQIQDDTEKVNNILLEFVETIQTHDALFDYSLKRHEYYKLFLNKITGTGRFKLFSPDEASKVLAGCFLTNSQLNPPESLIQEMWNEDTSLSKQTLLAR